MLWLTWRQFRVQAVTTAAVLAAAAVVLVITGIEVRDRAAAVGLPGCHAAHDCEQRATDLINQLQTSHVIFNVGVLLLYAVPALIGMFWGAPLIAREFETGTYRIAWNQSVSRDRWLATKLGLAGIAAVATAGLLSLLITWWAGPIDQAMTFAGPSAGRLAPVIFGARGIAPIGYAAFALVLGVLLGVLLRRTLPAMALTLVAIAAIQIVWPNWVRPHLISPAVARAPLGTEVDEFIISGANNQVTVVGAWHRPGAWVLSNQTITPAGHAFTGPAASACLKGSQQQCNAWLASKDLRQLVTFQSASRFWALQWYDTAVFVLLALVLAFCCAWRIRRRSALLLPVWISRKGQMTAVPGSEPVLPAR